MTRSLAQRAQRRFLHDLAWLASRGEDPGRTARFLRRFFEALDLQLGLDPAVIRSFEGDALFLRLAANFLSLPAEQLTDAFIAALVSLVGVSWGFHLELPAGAGGRDGSNLRGLRAAGLVSPRVLGEAPRGTRLVAARVVSSPAADLRGVRAVPRLPHRGALGAVPAARREPRGDPVGAGRVRAARAGVGVSGERVHRGERERAAERVAAVRGVRERGGFDA